MTDEHVDDPDPRGPDFDLDKSEVERKLRTIPVRVCPVCGEVHEDE